MPHKMAAPARIRLWTAERLERAGPPYDRAELWDGVPVVREPAGGGHGVTSATLIKRLGAHVGAVSAGWVLTTDTGFIIARAPDRVLAPDVAFVSIAKLRVMPSGFIPVVPDFVVEVKSPRDSETSVEVKAGVWLAHGVRVVWTADPKTRTVVVHRLGAVPFEARGDDAIVDAAPVLPEFRLRLAEVFEGLR